MRRLHQRAVSKFLEDTLLDIGPRKVIFSSPMNGFVMVLQTLFGIKNGFEFLPLDVKKRQSFNRRRLINGCNASNEVANVTYLLDGHGVLVFGDR